MFTATIKQPSTLASYQDQLGVAGLDLDEFLSTANRVQLTECLILYNHHLRLHATTLATYLFDTQREERLIRKETVPLSGGWLRRGTPSGCWGGLTRFHLRL